MTEHRGAFRARGRFGLPLRGMIVVGLVVSSCLVVCGNQADAGASVTLAPAGSAGADPFTASVQIGPTPTLAPPAQAAAATRGSRSPPMERRLSWSQPAPPLGSMEAQGTPRSATLDWSTSCPRIRRRPPRGAVFSGRLPKGSQLRHGLTPVVLTADTLVTNHGFNQGRATSIRWVLQAGTMAMVDDRGVPRVKCNCGNPLTPSELVAVADVDTIGATWEGYNPKELTAIRTGVSVGHSPCSTSAPVPPTTNRSGRPTGAPCRRQVAWTATGRSRCAR